MSDIITIQVPMGEINATLYLPRLLTQRDVDRLKMLLDSLVIPEENMFVGDIEYARHVNKADPND